MSIIKTGVTVALVAFAAYTIVADYCRFKAAIGYPCKSQERITTVAKTECPLSIIQYPPNIVLPRVEMKS